MQVSRDKLLEEFEAENEQLLAALSRSRANLAALHEQTANEARARARAEGEVAGDVLHAEVAELKARLFAQSDELGAAHNRALRAEELVEESELLVQDESGLRAAAEAKLEMLVTEMEQEDSRMLEEIELLKFTIEDKEETHQQASGRKSPLATKNPSVPSRCGSLLLLLTCALLMTSSHSEGRSEHDRGD